MALEQIYQPQVAPGATAALPMATPDEFGAGVGAGLAELGGTLHEAKLRAYQLQRQQTADSEATDFAARFAAARTEADRASIDARNNAAPGAAGHAAAMSQWWQDRSADLVAGITDDHVRRQAAAQISEFGDRFDTAEYQFEAGARVGKMVTDQQQASDLGANRARLAHDPKSFAEELSLGRQSIDALQGVPADVKAKLHRYHDETVSVGYLNGLNDTNPKAAMALLDGGAFNDLLKPEQLEQARNGAQVEVRRADAAAKAQQELVKHDAAEKIATINAQLEAGIDLPDATLAQAGQLAASIGDTSGAFKLDIARLKSGVNRETQPWTPVQFDAAINELRGLGAKRSPVQDVRLHQLEAIAPARKTEFDRNPGGWAAANGNPPPPLNLGDPASIEARRTWARGVSAAARRPVSLLTADEAAAFAANAKTPQGRLDTANQLAALGGLDAVDAARQAVPGDPMLARLVTLQPADRAAAIDGQATRKAYPQLVDGENGKAAREAFEARIANAGALLDGTDVSAAFEVARNLYADYAAKHGVQSYGTFNDNDVWTGIVHRALGGTYDPQGRPQGGVGTWNGAKVLLPSALTQGQFDAALAGLSWDPKNPHAPVFRDGTPMTPAQVRGYTPVRRPDGQYEFHGNDGSVLSGRQHGVWLLNIAPRGARR